EVDPAVRRAHDVVWAVELLAVPVRRDRLRRAVGQGHGHPARGVLAGEQTPLPIPREPLRLPARLPKRGDALGRRPEPQVVAWHVAPEQVALTRVPERALGEETAAGDLLERDVGADDRGEAGIASLKIRHAACARVSTNGNVVLAVAGFGSGGEERS